MDSWHSDYRRMWRDTERRRKRLRGIPLWRRVYEEGLGWSTDNAIMLSAWGVTLVVVWAVLCRL